MNRYQRALLFLLGSEALLAGFAAFALSQTLPNLRVEFGLTREQLGQFVAVINVGQILSYLLVRLADRWGRRPVWLLSVLGLAASSLATALTSHAVSFALVQLPARAFLLAAPAVSMIIAAEELPARRRGFLVGIIPACGALGGILCAALVPILNAKALGWRSAYLLGGLPLILVGVGWRWLRETEEFLREKPKVQAQKKEGLWSIWRSAYGPRLAEFAAIWFLTNLCVASTILFWKEFALSERGLRETQLGGIIATASLLAMPVAFLFGQLSDRLGRRPAAAIVYCTAVLGVWGAFSLRAPSLLVLSLLLAISGSTALPGLLSTLTAECFPTPIRARAFAWTNNLIGRSAFSIAPLLVGPIAESIGWGPAVLLTTAPPLVALVLLLRLKARPGDSPA